MAPPVGLIDGFSLTYWKSVEGRKSDVQECLKSEVCIVSGHANGNKMLGESTYKTGVTAQDLSSFEDVNARVLIVTGCKSATGGLAKAFLEKNPDAVFIGSTADMDIKNLENSANEFAEIFGANPNANPEAVTRQVNKDHGELRPFGHFVVIRP